MKTYISDSLISESLILLQTMKQCNCFSVAQIESIKTYYGINKTAALNLALQCKWIVQPTDGVFEMTPFGEKLLLGFSDMQIPKELYRDILYNYIIVCKPIWARKIPFGRYIAYRIMPDDVQVCFKKAGLMCDPVTRDEVDWWDALAKLERIEIEQQNDDVGRAGEGLTMEYERNRTNSMPVWESINSNLSGFDIISQVSSTDTSQILIEVKSSTQKLQDASFFVTYNEWEFASAECNKRRYYFYLWLLEGSHQLAVIPSSEIEKHIPVKSGQGKWSETIIPYSAFQDFFAVVN